MQKQLEVARVLCQYSVVDQPIACVQVLFGNYNRASFLFITFNNLSTESDSRCLLGVHLHSDYTLVILIAKEAIDYK